MAQKEKERNLKLKEENENLKKKNQEFGENIK